MPTWAWIVLVLAALALAWIVPREIRLYDRYRASVDGRYDRYRASVRQSAVRRSREPDLG